MTEQRRLAAIVSADVVGYSRLMGKDEGGTLAALKAVRQDVVDPAIAMHGGRKTTAMACCWSSRAWSMPCADPAVLEVNQFSRSPGTAGRVRANAESFHRPR